MKIVKDTLETLTQCVLLPGVELRFEDVLTYFKKGVGQGLKKRVKFINLHLHQKM